MTKRFESRPPSFWKLIRDILILPFTVTMVIPYLVHDYHPLSADGLLIKAIGILFMTLGFSLFLYTVHLFWTIGKGTLAPWQKTKNLVIHGPYRYCRNPMITGVFVILIGEALFLSSLTILGWAAIFFLINTIYFYFKEEPDMEKRFGNEYKEYKKNVPRWIPRSSPFQANTLK